MCEHKPKINLTIVLKRVFSNDAFRKRCNCKNCGKSIKVEKSKIYLTIRVVARLITFIIHIEMYLRLIHILFPSVKGSSFEWILLSIVGGILYIAYIAAIECVMMMAFRWKEVD